MQQPFIFKSAYTWWLFALLAFILFFRLGAAPIYILDEAKNAQCAREMLQRNDWVVPTFNGDLRTDKPVLHYYFMMLAYKMFGVNEFAARFFSALFGWLTVFITFAFVRRYLNELAAFCSALVLAASTQFLFEFRLSVPDPYLIFFITAGLFLAYRYLEDYKILHLLLAVVCLALATLTKGPVALALPGFCLLVWITWKKKWKQVFNWKLIPAFAILALVVLPWYLAVDAATKGAWTRGFFVEHNLNRFSDPQEGHGGFFLVTLLFVLLGLLPFASFAGELIRKRKTVFKEELVQFSGLVVAAFIIFFSIASTRLPNYPMPCYPFAAIVIGFYISKVVQGEITIKKYALFIVLGVMLLLPVAAFFALQQEKETATLSNFALLLLAGAMALLYVSFTWKNLSNFKKVAYLAGAYSVFNLLVLHVVYPIVYFQNPVAKTLATVKKYDHVFSYEIYNPGYNFYLNANIRRFHRVDSLKVALAQNPNAIIITRENYSDTLAPLNLKEVSRHHDLFEIPTTVLYAPGN